MNSLEHIIERQREQIATLTATVEQQAAELGRRTETLHLAVRLKLAAQTKLDAADIERHVLRRWGAVLQDWGGAMESQRDNAEFHADLANQQRLHAEQQLAERTAELELVSAELDESTKHWCVNREELERARAQIEPFKRYIRARLGIFSEFSRNAYPELMLSTGHDLTKEDWQAVTGEGEGKCR